MKELKSLTAAISATEDIDNGITMLNNVNTLFLQIPKNASTTMREYFISYAGKVGIELAATSKIRSLGPSEYKDNPRICVILRDPVAKHVSAAAMLVGHVRNTYGINVNVGDFVDLAVASDVHLVPQWAFVPLYNVPKFEPDINFFRKNTWNSFYFDLLDKYDFDEIINDQYDFFWLSEDPDQNVWTDICKHYDLPIFSEEKKHVAEYRKDWPVEGLGKLISSVHKHYACDYDFIRRIKFKNLNK